MASLSKCLSKLHSMLITHRDLKPSNFLYHRENRRGAIIDLSLCDLNIKVRDSEWYRSPEKANLIDRILKIQLLIGKNKFGTEGYMPLETILVTDRQGPPVDVWALGVIYLQLLIKKQFLFSQMNLIFFDSDGQKLKKVSNSIALFLIQLAGVFGPHEVKTACQQFGYFVSFPASIEGNFDLIQAHLKFSRSQLKEWSFLRQLLALDPRKRPSSFEAYRFFNDNQMFFNPLA